MVDVGMGKKYAVYFSRSYRNIAVKKGVRSLFHTAVNENVVPACGEERAGAGDLVGGA